MSIVEFAAAQGIELLPWQVAAAEAIERGDHPIMVGGKKAGRETFQRIVREWEARPVTTPDVCTAAQAEAERTYPKYPSGEAACEIDSQRHVKRKAYRKGAVWGAALVTPTREQIADALWGFPENVITLSRLNELAKLGLSDYSETRDYVYAQADAVLALMNTLTERNTND